eukprot:4009780-Lingulodinium_polyedra.AAC.1
MIVAVSRLPAPRPGGASSTISMQHAPSCRPCRVRSREGFISSSKSRAGPRRGACSQLRRS